MITSNRARVAASALLAASLAFIASCDCESCKVPDTGVKTDPAPVVGTTPVTTPPATAAPATGTSYTVRGQVVDVPDPANPVSEFAVRHEAIDDFKSATGEVVGMGAMNMPFPLGPGVSLADLKIGDIIEMDFEVQYQPATKWFATRIVKLPADTKLEFREARPVK